MPKAYRHFRCSREKRRGNVTTFLKLENLSKLNKNKNNKNTKDAKKGYIFTVQREGMLHLQHNE